MSELEQENTINELDAPLPTLVADEAEGLRSRLKLMNVPFHHKEGLESLRKKLEAALAGEKTDSVEETKKTQENLNVNLDITVADLPETAAEVRMRIRREALKLVRIRVTCMNQNKKDWLGEVFSFSNSAIAAVKKYVPFNAEEGYHVPQCLLNVIRERKYQVPYKDKSSGKEITRMRLVPEFAIEIMDPLSPAELKDLATRQAMSRSV